MSSFLRFVVNQTLAGKSEMLKESVIGVHVFARDPSYDPKTDPVVRGEARRLRAKLLDYSHNHADDPLWIDLPKGGYVPEFHWREPPTPAPVSSGVEQARPSWIRQTRRIDSPVQRAANRIPIPLSKSF